MIKTTTATMHVLRLALNLSLPGKPLSGAPISSSGSEQLISAFQLPRTKPESPSLLEQEMSSIRPVPPRPQFQHYVPRFLLRRWVDVKTVTKR